MLAKLPDFPSVKPRPRLYNKWVYFWRVPFGKRPKARDQQTKLTFTIQAAEHMQSGSPRGVNTNIKRLGNLQEDLSKSTKTSDAVMR